MELNRQKRASRGRPRTFDVDKALDKALKVFWRKGYEEASMPDLTRAMGINRPSLYSAFGNKQSLFCKALQRYNEQQEAKLAQALAATTAREVVRRILRDVIDRQTCPGNPRGCLHVRGSLSCGSSPVIRKSLTASRVALEGAIADRLQRAVEEGDLPTDASPRDLTRYLLTVIQGLSIQSASGASREQLLGIADTALAVFPASGER